MIIREFTKGDEDVLLKIFKSSIRENAKSYYSEDQLKAWAPDEIDLDKWALRIQGIKPYVLVEGQEVIGYGDLQESGYIDHFFIKGGQAGKGAGRKLLSYIIDQALSKGINELTADVSLAAQPFFKKFGFEIIERKVVNIRGVDIDNAFMKKIL